VGGGAVSVAVTGVGAAGVSLAAGVNVGAGVNVWMIGAGVALAGSALGLAEGRPVAVAGRVGAAVLLGIVVTVLVARRVAVGGGGVSVLTTTITAAWLAVTGGRVSGTQAAAQASAASARYFQRVFTAAPHAAGPAPAALPPL
jgi:hypothetical protein